MKNKLVRFAALLLTAFLLVWGIALLRCEILTARHLDGLLAVHPDNLMLGEMEAAKVLNYRNQTAEVYWLAKDQQAGFRLSFAKDGTSWEETGWECIWSRSGSASGVVWPYWLHVFRSGT